MWHFPQPALHTLIIFSILLFLHLSDTQPVDGSRRTTDQWLSKRQRHSSFRGLQVIPGTCVGADLTAVKNGIRDASYLAGAGLNAAANFTGLPFRYFFKDDIATANKVAGVYRRVQSSQQGHSELIGVTCQDVFKNCNLYDQNFISPAYSAQATGRPPVIVFCRLGLTLPRNPKPCSENPGTITLGQIMLHELVHIFHISGPGLDVDDTTGDTARDVNKALVSGTDTTLDANAYMYLGGWAWDLGLGGAPWNQRKVCLEKFRRGKFDETLGNR